MNTYSQTLYEVKKTKSGSDEISQGQRISLVADFCMGVSGIKITPGVEPQDKNRGGLPVKTRLFNSCMRSKSI